MSNKRKVDVNQMYSIKLDNISSTTTPELLREKFNEFGEIGDVYIPRNYGSMEPRGYAFVRFLNKRDAEYAQDEMDGKEIDGNEIRIQDAKEKKVDPRMYGGNNRYGRGSRDDRSYRRRDDSYDRYRHSRRSRSRSSDHSRRRGRKSRYHSRSRSGSRNRDRNRDESRDRERCRDRKRSRNRGREKDRDRDDYDRR